MTEKNYSASLSRIAVLTKDSFEAISEYLFGLSDLDALKLSLTFEEIKEAHEKYRALLSALLQNIDKMDADAAALSGFISALERERDISTARRLSAIFEAYLLWKKSVNDFVSKCDDIFRNKGEKYKLSLNVIYTRTLISSTEHFISALSR